MTQQDAMSLIARYYAAFNAGNQAAMLDCVSDEVEHRVNQGEIRLGRTLFAEFCGHMGVSYRETLKDLVIFADEGGTRAAAEFSVHGSYLATDPGLPVAHGQTYQLPAGAFFDLHDHKITRISTFYNLTDWITQVST